MWGESSKECESNCQCSGLITDSFKINSGNSATKRRREEAISHNFKLRMNPNCLDFTHKSPTHTPKRRVLGEIQNSPLVQNSTLVSKLKSPLNQRQQSPLSSLINSPKLNSPFVQRSTKISRIFEERTRYRGSKMSNKENECFESETLIKLEMSEETRNSAFSELGHSPVGRVLQRSKTVKNWTLAKMSSDSPEHTITKKTETTTSKRTIFGHDEDIETLDSDFETLHDLDAEFDCDNYDQCSKYEIISTDSPDIISRGRASSSRKISSKNFVFGAPIAENEQSTSFNTKPNATATRMLNFGDETFEFTSPDNIRPRSTQTSVSVKKSLKFYLGDTPTKTILSHENSNSSIGSMSTMSPLSTQGSKLRLFPSESMTSMESGFMSEIDEAFLDLEDTSNSPKVADFSELLSGKIKDNLACEAEFSLKRPTLQRSLSYNPEASKVRVSLFSKGEDEKKSQKRADPLQERELSCNKRRKANCDSPAKKIHRPVLQRAYSENAASVMSALARSASNPDLIGDFTVPFALPTTSGMHSDLKSISCDTLAALLKGEFNDSVADFQVIDCRYPYEFAGGHIVGARNLYTPELVLSLISEKGERDAGRRVIVFHCEFSIERGPKLSRFLRSSDRTKNQEFYPSLHYPEIYLLHKGYSAFHKEHPELCSGEYTMMMDPSFKEELARFRRIYPSSGKLPSARSFRL